MSPRRMPDSGLSFFAEWGSEARTDPVTTTEQAGSGRRRWTGRRTGVLVAILATCAAASVVLPGSAATADPSAHDWYRLRMCESGNNYSINTGNGHYGAYQFDLATWRSVGGTGYPQNASPAEQDARALILYRERGWQPWQCAGIVGLREDGDARSGRIGDIRVPHSGRGHSTGRHHSSHRGVPAFPGSHSFVFGDHNTVIKRFQNRMHARGVFPPGTGEYGRLTLAMVKRLQRLNGIRASGLLGPKTWRAAWVGKFRLPVRVNHGSVPPFPGSVSYRFGDTAPAVRVFQNQMHRRGYFPRGNGHYGPLTRAMVKRLQRLNGIRASGLLGPKTWRAAWVGTYHAATAHHRTISVPPFPGAVSYRFGDHAAAIKVFQNEMHRRGFFPPGTGQYGPLTLRMVKRLQRLNGIRASGLLGPKTWRAAYVGRYRRP